MNKEIVDNILKSRQMYAILSCHSVEQLLTTSREDKKHSLCFIYSFKLVLLYIIIKDYFFLNLMIIFIVL